VKKLEEERDSAIRMVRMMSDPSSQTNVLEVSGSIGVEIWKREGGGRGGGKHIMAYQFRYLMRLLLWWWW